jgi:hypothetical protein
MTLFTKYCELLSNPREIDSHILKDVGIDVIIIIGGITITWVFSCY